MPFVSDADLDSRARRTRACAHGEHGAIVDENAEARLDALRASLSVLAVLALVALFFSRGLPTTPAASADT